MRVKNWSAQALIPWEERRKNFNMDKRDKKRRNKKEFNRDKKDKRDGRDGG
jgi:hypothetical protein